MRETKIITIVGAGSSRTPALVGSIVDYKERFPLEKIIFFDIDPIRMGKMQRYMELVLKQEMPECQVIFTTDKELAYTGVDAVLVQMRAGNTAMRSLDEKIPLKHGLVGQETCGPGGFAYGMRSIGAMIEMVNDIRAVNKDAWILNYTNPAAIVAVALDKVFPDDKRILNLCDQPYSMMRTYAKILGKEEHTLKAEYFGLNHFGWFTDIVGKEDNKSYFNEVMDYLGTNEFKPYNAEQRSQSWLETYKRVNKYLSFFTEYLPNTYLQYYFFPEEIVEESDPNYTRADEAVASREKDVFELCAKAEGRDTLGDLEILKGSVFGNLMIEVAESILYDLNEDFVVIVKNNGIIPNFSPDAMIEVAGTLGKDGPTTPVYGEIKPFYKGLMEGQYAYELLTVESYLEESYEKALMALTLNRSIVDPQKAKAVLDDLMEANKDYWVLK
ncbi:6-phospho-alpha-glucosidase [Erysipelothrix sp. HDW6A]|uniref:family 4 glycosyl hydrolase n=1 Tax=Erysipelothrix sp. HDW6A TaxID=2714928 RepID=UPI00140E5967|nr:6-phospho-alpha-glucosidase [Erysipelothrix sp. HDW6A]QIK57858.1 6-phospho-alpha-glucosidase [Erysipelothrix sp. HDW6A]